MTTEEENKADGLIQYLKKGKGIFDAFDRQFKEQYLIYGKTIKEWETYFQIKIPQEVGIFEGKKLNAEIAKLAQEAAFYLAASDAVLKALEQGSVNEYQTKFTALVVQYKQQDQKLPAQKTLETLANQEFDDVKAAATSATIANDFWEHIVKSLDRSAKRIESIGLLLNAESKLIHK